MGRSLADLAALATDPNLDPFERMCHAATLTNRAHATTAALARTCAVRARRPWRTWVTFWPCQRGTWAAWLAGSNCALVALAERRRAPRAWRRPGRCSLRCAPLRAALPFGAAVVVQTPDPIAQFDPTQTNPSHEPRSPNHVFTGCSDTETHPARMCRAADAGGSARPPKPPPELRCYFK